jgi:large subunit ribosomal protein L2
VRGVAMNAVDHPHGGRTKSLRYPQTPWGKSTKGK